MGQNRAKRSQTRPNRTNKGYSFSGHIIYGAHCVRGTFSPGHNVSRGALSSGANCLRGTLSPGAHCLPGHIVSWGILSPGAHCLWGRLSPGHIFFCKIYFSFPTCMQIYNNGDVSITRLQGLTVHLNRAIMLWKSCVVWCLFGPFLMDAYMLKVFCFVSSLWCVVSAERAASLPSVNQYSALVWCRELMRTSIPAIPDHKS